MFLDSNVLNTCIVCGHVKGKDEKVSLHRFPADPTKRLQWLTAVHFTEETRGL